MFILGVLLIAAGVIAIVGAVVDLDGSAELLGTDLGALSVFLLGVAAGVAILWGFAIAKFGARKTLERRREHKQLGELSEKLDRVEADRRAEGDDQRT